MSSWADGPEWCAGTGTGDRGEQVRQSDAIRENIQHKGCSITVYTRFRTTGEELLRELPVRFFVVNIFV